MLGPMLSLAYAVPLLRHASVSLYLDNLSGLCSIVKGGSTRSDLAAVACGIQLGIAHFDLGLVRLCRVREQYHRRWLEGWALRPPRPRLRYPSLIHRRLLSSSGFPILQRRPVALLVVGDGTQVRSFPYPPFSPFLRLLCLMCQSFQIFTSFMLLSPIP